MSFNLEKSTLWSTVLNAADRSRRISNTGLPWSIDIIISCFTRIKAVSWPLLYANCNDSLKLLLIKYLLRWNALALSMTLDNNVRFETGLKCLETPVHIVFCFINGFIYFWKTPRDNDLLTIFVIRLIRTARQYFTSHVSIGPPAQKALDYPFGNQSRIKLH